MKVIGQRTASGFRQRKLAAAVAWAVAAGLVTVPVAAQDVRVEVTGSNIKRVESESASPIEVITRQDIERTGAQTIGEVLQYLPSAGWAIDDRVTNGFTNGASALNVRNLGFNSTLVLLNGRRLPTYPLAQRTTLGSQQFQDLNAIPVAAVQRIEILKDGASAIYGADAVGGVVNIILRTNYDGAEASAGYGIAERGDAEMYTVNASIGFGDLAKDKYNVFFNAYYFKREAALTDERDFANNEDLRSRGGGDLRSSYGYPGTLFELGGDERVQVYPNCTSVRGGICRYNRASFGGVLPEVERAGILAKGEWAFSPNVSTFGELMYSQNKAYNIGFPSPSTDDPGIGSNILPVGHPSNPFPYEAQIRHRYADVGNRDNDASGDTWRGVLGLKGNFKSWDWEVYGSWSEIDLEENQLNNVLGTTALATINDRSYNFLNPFANPASVTERLRYNGFHTGNSRFDDYGARASGEVWSLPAGPILAAVGVQYTTLEVEDIPDPNIAAGNALGISASAAFGRQDLTAVYGEIIVPVIKGLEISGALRYDKYSESGDFSNTSPKVGVRWQPTKGFLFRTTYSEAFRAPSIFETSAATQSSFEFGLVDPTRCINGTEPDCNLDVKLIQTGNPNLKPEESKIFNIGVVWEPINNLTLSLDYWKVDRENEISLFGTQTLINLFPNNPAIVVRDPTGEIDQVNNVPVQLSGTKTSGYDFDVRARIPTDSWGTFSPRLVVSYIDEYTFKTIGDSGQIESFNYNGTHNQPRLRATWDLAWQYGAHELSLNGYYIHNMDQLNPIASGEDIDSTAIWNLFWKWNFAKNWSLNASVVNLFDEDPPFSNETQASNAGYNASQHDPRGRYYQMGITYRFK